MEISVTPPHLIPQPVPAFYPATNVAFENVAEEPVVQIGMSRANNRSVKYLWILALLALVGAIVSLVLGSVVIFGGASIVFVILAAIAVFSTTGARSRYASWRHDIDRGQVYTPILAFTTGVYVRTDSSTPNYIFLPWSAISAVSLETDTSSGKSVALSLTSTAVAVVNPTNQLDPILHVAINGAILNAFGLDTPEKIAQALQDIVQSQQTVASAGGAAPAMPASVVNAKNSLNMLVAISMGIIFVLMVAVIIYMHS
jgi:hypothetical protein